MTERRPFEDILVPLDGSPAAERALVPALELVSRTGVPLRLVSRALYDEKEQLAEYLAGVSDRYAAVTDVETEVVDVESIPEAITDGMEPGTLVCMTSHGRGRTEALVGSITEAVLRTLRQPMLVVGPQIPEDSPLGGGWIVACLDGSDLAERCLEPAGTWSRSLGLPLWFVQVVPPRPPGERRRDEGVAETAYLASLAHRSGGVEGWEVLYNEDPAHGLAGLAATAPVAVLVIATHGRTGWDRLRFGSVTASTIHRSSVPVLVVPAVTRAE